MIRRALILLVLGGAMGLLFATALQPTPVRGEEAPAELRAAPAPLSQVARDLSRPFVEATRRVRPAVVLVENWQSIWGRRVAKAGSGSGVIVSKEGHILTNRHVVFGAQRIDVLLPDGRRFQDVQVVGKDVRSDIAVLRLPPTQNLSVAALGDSDALDVGDWVIAIGAPFELEASVSAGVVSATGRTRVFDAGPDSDMSEDFIQTDAALNPGNSGGPLINLDGQVVGINTAIQTGGGRQNAGVGFAVPVNLARTVAIALIERGVASRGWLGVMGVQVDPSKLAERGIQASGGFLVQEVVKDRSAAKAGVRPGDVLLAIDGKPLRDQNALRARLAVAGPGTEVELTLARDGQERKLRVRLEEEPIYAYGLEVRNLDAKTAAQVGLPAETVGVVVTKIAEDSPAKANPDQQEMYPGDVIVAVDVGTRRFVVSREDDFVQAMQAARNVPAVRFWIRVKEGNMQVVLTRPELK